MKKLIVLWVALPSLNITTSYASTALDTLLVSVTARPVQTNEQMLTTDQLLPGIGSDSAEYLTGIAGLQVDSRSNYAQDTRITLRGFGARSAFGVRGIDLQIDGIPLSTPDGQGQFSGVILDNTRQVSVLTGPIAALYGNGAGGVIAFQTQVPTATSLALSGSLDESGMARQQLLGEFQQDDFALRGQATHLQADGDRPHASAEREQLGAQAYYYFDNGIQAQWRFDKEDAPLLQDPLGLTLAQWREDPRQLNSSADFFDTRKEIHHQQNGISLRQDEGDQRWQAAAWQGERSVVQYLAQKGDAIANSGGVVDLDRDFSGANGNYTWDFTPINQAASFTLGGEWSSMDDRRKGYINNAGLPGALRRDELGRVDGQDLYAVAQWQPTSTWQWLGGVRHAHINFDVDDYFIVPGNGDDSGKRSFSYLSRALETRYQLNPRWSIHASTGRGFETPTLTEAAYTSGDTGFNQSLDAALNQQNELGLEFRQAQLHVALTGFTIDTKNEIVVDQSINGRTSYRNAAATKRTGVELAGDWQWSPAWSARLNSSYINAEYGAGENDGNFLPGVARLNQYAQLNWKPYANNALRLSVALTHRSSVYTNDDNLVQAPGFTTVDFSVSGDFGPMLDSGARGSNWWVKLSNLGNETYVGSVIVNQTNGRAFEPAPERVLAAGITIKWQ